MAQNAAEQPASNPADDWYAHMDKRWPMMLWTGVPWLAAARIAVARQRMTLELILRASHLDVDNPKSPFFTATTAGQQAGVTALVEVELERQKERFAGGDLEVLQDPRRVGERAATFLDTMVLPKALEEPGAYATVTGIDFQRPMELDARWDIHPGNGQRGLPTLTQYLEWLQTAETKAS